MIEKEKREGEVERERMRVSKREGQDSKREKRRERIGEKERGLVGNLVRFS